MAGLRSSLVPEFTRSVVDVLRDIRDVVTLRNYSARQVRLIAIVAGLVAFLLSVATPLLPVRQDTASIDWPQPGKTSVTAPLVSYVPLKFSATIPCSAVAKLPNKSGVLLSTVPGKSAQASARGLVVKVATDTLLVLQRDIPLLSVPLAELSRCAQLRIESTSTRTAAELVAAPGHTAAHGASTNRHGAPVDRDVRPQMVGIFTEIPAGQLQGFDAHAELDSRFTSTPTALKWAAMVLAVLATVLALIALYRLDSTDGRRSRRWVPMHWLRVTVADAVVGGVLVLWHVIGGNTSDDGYILTMARVSPHAGYTANYYRWFGVPEAPFGWTTDVLSVLARVSDASLWIRLPSLAAGILCWLLISREVLPRLGAKARHNKLALWTAGLVFLAFWMPYDNGLRPEPLIALGALLTWCLVERAIATGRVLPAAAAVLVAAFSLAAGPTGLICVAALAAGSRPVLQIVLNRSQGLGTRGYAAAAGPILAAGTVVLVVVFAGQTLASVLEATRVRTLVGPNVAWFDEFHRWSALLTQSPDGSLARRFGVFMMLLCLIVCVMQVLRKGGQLPGVAKGPSTRILGIIFASLFLMMFTPTKWTHHFGVYAGLAGSLAALTGVAMSSSSLRSRRNRALFGAAVLFLMAQAFTGTNGWWYVSSYGIPWWDKAPSIGGKGLSTGLLALSVLSVLLGAWFHYREPHLERLRRQAARHSEQWTVAPVAPRNERRRFETRFAPAPLTIAAAFMVLFEVLIFAKGAIAQSDSYSIAKSNLDSLTGDHCALANSVLVEPNPNASMLQPVPGQPGTFAAATTGFTADGIAADLTPDKQSKASGGANSVDAGSGAAKGAGSATSSAGTDIGKSLPFGLDSTTPVMGSYSAGDKKPASFTSRWYRLTRPENAPLLTIAAAGRIRSVDASGVVTYGQEVRVEYGTAKRDGTVARKGAVLPLDPGPSPVWRNLRVPLADIPDSADAVRIVAVSNDLTTRQWVAVTPPRVPKLRTLQSVVGSKAPVLLDWHVGLAFPCQRPFDHRDGVAEVPRFRILPDRVGQESSDAWEDNIGGGPLGWSQLLLSEQTVPSYLDNDWRRDWGQLERLIPLDPKATPAEVDVTEVDHSGLYKESPILARS